MSVCKICSSVSKPIFKTLILNKYDVQYYKCLSCDFIQTENPYWLSEAYSSAITAQDIGLIYRNNFILPILRTVIKTYFNKKKSIVDYGGGYGVLVRLLRDSGFDAYRFDIYCNNLFAAGFDDLGDGRRYEILTAFEVFEHLEDPLNDIKKMLQFSDSIFFSTEIQTNSNVSPDNWWYIMPETGQHIALYSLKSLRVLASKLNLNFYTNGSNYHLLTKKILSPFLFRCLLKNRIANIVDSIVSNPPSKLKQDYNLIKGE